MYALRTAVWYSLGMAHPNQAFYSRRAYLKGSHFIDSLKQGSCVDCGGKFPPVAMDFDHVRGVKRANIAGMKNHGLAAIQEEVAKCDLVCANCHRVRTETRRVPSQNPYRQTLMARLVELKKAPCADCRGTFDPKAMEFDHTTEDKVTCVSECWSWAKMQEEAAKCDLVCANCHRVRTHDRRQSGSPMVKPHTLAKRARHRELRRRVEALYANGLALLGTVPDVVLARQFKLDKSTVREHRIKLGIPAFSPPRPWISELGTMTDAALAEKYGKNPEVIRRQRNAMGIQPWGATCP